MSSHSSDDDDSRDPNFAESAAPVTFEFTSPPPTVYGKPPLYFEAANKLNLYLPGEVIGHTKAGAIKVYKGMFVPFGCHPLTIPVLLRQVSLDQIEYWVSVRDNNRNLSLDNPNIVAVKEEVNDRGSLWVVFEYSGPSLRSLGVKYQYQTQILFMARTLYSTVNALVSIHQENMVHGEVNLGHIYRLQQSDNTYVDKLGFAATVYECGQPTQYSEADPFFPSCDICSWGAAPELMRSKDEISRTAASDIWLVGITALELALGPLKVTCREDLDDLIASAVSVWNTGVFGDSDFKNFIADCLKYDPAMRATSRELMYDAFFRKHSLGPGLE